MAEVRGFRVINDPQEEQDFIRGFVRGPGPVATTRPAEQLRRPRPGVRSADDMRREAFRRENLANEARTPDDVGEPFGTTVRAAREAETARRAQDDAVVAAREAAARTQVGLRPLGPEVGPPSNRRFEFTPGEGRGLRGEIEFGARQPQFERNFQESLEAGAYDPLTQARFESAQRVQEGRGRALRGLRQLAAARRGVPEQFLGAVRQGNLSAREANVLGAQTGGGGGGASAADLIKLQQGERRLRIQERRADTSRANSYREGFESDSKEVREMARERAVTDAIRDPDDEVANNMAAEGIALELMEKGDPGFLDTILPFHSSVPGFLRGSPQGMLDPDTEASAVGVLSKQLQQGDMVLREYRGVPTLFAGEDPVVAWGDLSPRTRQLLTRRRLIRVERPGLRQE